MSGFQTAEVVCSASAKPSDISLPPFTSPRRKPPMSPTIFSDCDKFPFQTAVSPGASTCLPSPCFARQNSYGTDTFDLGSSHYDASMCFEEVFEGGHHIKEFFLPARSNSAPLDAGHHIRDDLQSDSDGAMWVTTDGCLDAKHQGTYEGRVQLMQNTLGGVKALFKAKYGEELSDDDRESKVDAGISSEGADGAKQLDPCYLVRLASLEQKLADVKAAYCDKYSCDADADDVISQDEKLEKLEHLLNDVKALHQHKFGHSVDDMGEDGAVWVTTGKSTLVESKAYLERQHALEGALCDVKTLYSKRFGLDVDQDEVADKEIQEKLDADGATWVVRSVKPSDEEEDQDSQQEAKLQELVSSLHDVKALYAQKHGHNVDDKDVDEDRALWLHFAGCAAETHPLDQLEEKLAHVKVLYQKKFGADLHDDTIEGDMSYEEKVQVLENSLGGLKVLYEQKYGHTVDDLDDDGTVWMTTGVPQPQDEYEQRLHGLQSKLAEVKSLFNEKYSYEDKTEALEDSVMDVKLLFEQKYGCGVDNMDDDRALWIKTGESAKPQDTYDLRLAGLASKLTEDKTLYDQKYHHDEKVESLEESMNDVKLLFEQKYGYSIDDDMDGDGAPWGREACLADLESMLAEVKTWYNEKYSYDEKLPALEASLSDVKELFEKKYGCDIDDMDDQGAP